MPKVSSKPKIQLTAMDIVPGHWYRGKRYREGLWHWSNNDRKVVYTNGVLVQYDSDTVGMGKRFPKLTMEQFLRWAAREVTSDELEAWNEKHGFSRPVPQPVSPVHPASPEAVSGTNPEFDIALL